MYIFYAFVVCGELNRKKRTKRFHFFAIFIKNYINSIVTKHRIQCSQSLRVSSFCSIVKFVLCISKHRKKEYV